MNLVSSLRVYGWASFEDAPFIPNHYSITCSQWACLPVKCFLRIQQLSQSFDAPVPTCLNRVARIKRHLLYLQKSGSSWWAKTWQDKISLEYSHVQYVKKDCKLCFIYTLHSIQGCPCVMSSGLNIFRLFIQIEALFSAFVFKAIFEYKCKKDTTLSSLPFRLFCLCCFDHLRLYLSLSLVLGEFNHGLVIVNRHPSKPTQVFALCIFLHPPF